MFGYCTEEVIEDSITKIFHYSMLHSFWKCNFPLF